MNNWYLTWNNKEKKKKEPHLPAGGDSKKQGGCPKKISNKQKTQNLDLPAPLKAGQEEEG